jgi:hypothetical protein
MPTTFLVLRFLNRLPLAFSSHLIVILKDIEERDLPWGDWNKCHINLLDTPFYLEPTGQSAILWKAGR